MDTKINKFYDGTGDPVTIKRMANAADVIIDALNGGKFDPPYTPDSIDIYIRDIVEGFDIHAMKPEDIGGWLIQKVKDTLIAAAQDLK
jgi:hypothetical protein